MREENCKYFKRLSGRELFDYSKHFLLEAKVHDKYFDVLKYEWRMSSDVLYKIKHYLPDVIKISDEEVVNGMLISRIHTLFGIIIKEDLCRLGVLKLNKPNCTAWYYSNAVRPDPEIERLWLTMRTRKEDAMKNNLPEIKKVYFNKPYTIVIWKDGTKTMVKCENEIYDHEKGLAIAIAKKALGTNKSGSNYYDEFKKWLPKEKGPTKTDFIGAFDNIVIPKETEKTVTLAKKLAETNDVVEKYVKKYSNDYFSYIGCPCHYSCLNKSHEFGKSCPIKPNSEVMTCIECWNRPYIEKKGE